MDFIHSDICGPMSSPSLSGCLYYVLFIDDHSRKSWIYFLKVKSETFDKFKEFKALIENQTGRHIRILRSDNKGEYESNEFDDFYQEARIKRELTVPYNPQQNGVAERKNRTVCEVAKAMLTNLIFLYLCGLKLHVLLCTFKTEALMPSWGKRLQKKYLQERNLQSNT